MLLPLYYPLLAPQSGALRISAYRDFQSIPTTYSFRAFKPFYGDLKQLKQANADQKEEEEEEGAARALRVFACAF